MMQLERRSPLRVPVLLLLFLLLAGLLTGCWDNREPRRRAFVLGLGVDPDEEREGHLRVTAQLPVPFAMKGGGGEAKPAKEHFWVSGSGPTLTEALTRIQDRLSREMFLGQARSVVLSSRLQADQLQLVIDELRRNPNIEETMYLVMADGRAADLMETPTPQERLPALYFNTVFEAVKRLTVSAPVQLWEFWRVLKTPGWEPVLPVARAAGLNEISLTGTAVFRGPELQGFLNRQESQGLFWLLGRTVAGTLTAELPEGTFEVRSLRIGRTVSHRFEQGRPVFTIRLRVSGEVAAATAHPVDLARLRELEAAAAGDVLRQAEMAMRRMQQDFRSDILGLGRRLHYQEPAYFDAVRWEEVFPGVRVEVEVEMILTRKGVLH
jgi:spore germination protein KC